MTSLDFRNRALDPMSNSSDAGTSIGKPNENPMLYSAGNFCEQVSSKWYADAGFLYSCQSSSSRTTLPTGAGNACRVASKIFFVTPPGV